MFCSKCGKEIPADSLYCPYCGAKQEIQTQKSEEKPSEETAPEPEFDEADAPEERPEDHTTYLFAVLSLVFGALGGLLGVLFGVLTLLRKPNNQEKAMAIVGIACFILWLIGLAIYLALILLGVIPLPETKLV